MLKGAIFAAMLVVLQCLAFMIGHALMNWRPRGK